MLKERSFKLSMILTGLALVCVVILFLIWFFDFGHGMIEKVPALHGLTDVELYDRLGEPGYVDEVSLSNGLDEFRVELYNAYPPDDPGTQGVIIKEATWAYARYNITVWLHDVQGEWVVLDTCRWRKDVQF